MNTKPKQIIEIDATKAVELVKHKADSIGEALSLRVVSKPTYEQAGIFMGMVREAKKLLREKKKPILDHIRQVKEDIETLFEPAEKKVGAIEIYLKNQISGYNIRLQEEERQRVKEAEDKIREAQRLAEKNKAELPKNFITETTKKAVNTQEKIDVIPTRKVPRVRIIDFSKVSDEFKILNDKKALEVNENGIKVEGLEFYVEEIIVNRF